MTQLPWPVVSRTQAAFRWELRGDIFCSDVMEIRADKAVAQNLPKPDLLALALG